MNRLNSDASIIEALRRNGYRATPQRIAISRLTLQHRSHPTAETIYNEVKEFHPTVSLSTVYNTLHIIKDLNMVQELAFNDDVIRFDPNIRPHLNIVCKRCGRIIDVEDKGLKEVIERAVKKVGFHPTGQRFDLYGICKKCMDKLKKEHL